MGSRFFHFPSGPKDHSWSPGAHYHDVFAESCRISVGEALDLGAVVVFQRGCLVKKNPSNFGRNPWENFRVSFFWVQFLFKHCNLLKQLEVPLARWFLHKEKKDPFVDLPNENWKPEGRVEVARVPGTLHFQARVPSTYKVQTGRVGGSTTQMFQRGSLFKKTSLGNFWRVILGVEHLCFEGSFEGSFLKGHFLFWGDWCCFKACWKKTENRTSRNKTRKPGAQPVGWLSFGGCQAVHNAERTLNLAYTNVGKLKDSRKSLPSLMRLNNHRYQWGPWLVVWNSILDHLPETDSEFTSEYGRFVPKIKDCVPTRGLGIADGWNNTCTWFWDGKKHPYDADRWFQRFFIFISSGEMIQFD